MADSFVQGRKLYVGGRDLSGDWTTIALRGGREPVEFTRGADNTRHSKAGLRSVAFEAEGIADLGADLQDEELASFVDLSDVPIIVTPVDGADGATAWGFKAEMGDFTPINGGAVGGPLNFRVSARASSSRLVRGLLAIPDTELSATTNGTAFELGAVGATQKLYACVQCLAISGTNPTVDVVIAGDSVSTFLGTPETQITFTQITAAGAYEWKEVSGALADTWWRAQVTIGGTDTPTTQIVVLLAIA